MALAATLALIVAHATQAMAGPPAEIAGTWDVEHVRVDDRDALRWNFKPDDPQLVGRTLIISSEKVRFEEGKAIGCVQNSWQLRRTTWSLLFSKGFARARREGVRSNAVPTDYDTKVSARGQTTAYEICPPEKTARNQFPNDHWVALQEPGLLLLRLDDMTLLVLRRREPNAAPKASFDCQKATTPTEKAICASHDLASWDRSVAAAFRNAIQRREPEEVAQIRAQQKAWLHERDACGAETACIDEHQWRRVEDLVQE